MNNRPNILIVDDKDTNLYTLQKVLSEVDANIISALNGNDALKATLNHDFSLAILDVQMPGMDGFELAELMRSMEKNEFLPIIFLSAVFSDEYHISKAYKSGAIDFIKKPINETILLSKVQVFLELDRQKLALRNNQKKLEKLIIQLKISNEQHQGIFDAVTESLLVINQSGFVVEANPAACKTYGYTYKEMLKLNLLQLLHGDSKDNLDEIGNNLNNSTVLFGESIHVRKNNDAFYVEARFTNFNFSDSPHYLIVIRDITKRKEADKAIKKNELRFRSIFESAGVSIMEMDFSKLQKSVKALLLQGVTDLKTYYKENPEHLKILINHIKVKNVNSETLKLFEVETKDDLQSFLPETYLPDTYDAFLSALVEISNGGGYFEAETVRRSFSGKTINVIQKWTIPENVSEFNSMLLILIDITNRKKAEKEINDAKIVAETANRAKSEFLANMSHEIRTPMNAILGFSEILDDKISDKELKDYIVGISASGKNLLVLINDILDLSKIEAGKFELKYAATNIENLLEEIKHIFSLKVVEKKLKLITSIGENLPHIVNIDETRLRQILFNLVGNAVKFTNKGSITISAKSQESNDPDLDESSRNSYIDLFFEVGDTGIGIPEEQQTLIFSPFIQQDGQNTRRYGGTGLGLAITKRLVEMMKGTISLKSTLGIGSNFSFVLQNIEIIDAPISEANVLSAENLESNRIAIEREKEQEPDTKQSVNFIELLKNLSPEDFTYLKTNIEEKISPAHKNASQTLSVNKIREFAQLTIDIGNKLSLKPLVAYATNLMQQTRMFKFDEIMISLPKFNDFLETIRAVD